MSRPLAENCGGGQWGMKGKKKPLIGKLPIERQSMLTRDRVRASFVLSLISAGRLDERHESNSLVDRSSEIDKKSSTHTNASTNDYENYDPRRRYQLPLVCENEPQT